MYVRKAGNYNKEKQSWQQTGETTRCNTGALCRGAAIQFRPDKQDLSSFRIVANICDHPFIFVLFVEKYFLLYLHVRQKVKTWASWVFVKFNSTAMQEVNNRLQIRLVNMPQNWDVTINLSISRKITEGNHKDNNILLMHTKALELWDGDLVPPSRSLQPD